MKKQISRFLLGAVLVCSLTACGSKSDKVNVDISKLAEDLQGTITSGALAEVPSDIFASTFFLDMEKVAESTALLNSGASACEVVIVKCSDSSYAEKVEELFETRVENQAALFASYNAPEAAKLDKAVIESAGEYVVLCVSDDPENAEKILEKAGF